MEGHEVGEGEVPPEDSGQILEFLVAGQHAFFIRTI